MPTKNLQTKRVTVMGLGLHGGGTGTVLWLLEQGAQVTVTDLRNEQELRESVDAIETAYPKQVTWVLGEHREKDFSNTDLIVRNPAVRSNSPYLEIARKTGVPIEMDSSLFFLHSPTQDIIGVTGSKGKTTASNAVAHLLFGSVPVGVDGVSPLGELKKISVDSTAVFELSSWRLEALGQHNISPRTAVVTSIYREHLNTYESMEEYVETKKTILKHQTPKDVALLNWDDDELKTWEPVGKGKKYWFSMKELPSDKEGIYVEDDKMIVRTAPSTTLHPRGVKWGEKHYVRNILPAVLIAHLRGMKNEEIEQALETLPGLPHRLEFIREVDGVRYINDSTATMPDATIAALEAHRDDSLVLILGGDDKQLEFSELAKKVSQTNIRAIVWLPGTATEQMKVRINETTDVPYLDAERMDDAIQKASETAQSGDVVLLTPGATSFSLFKHEFDRGDQFRAAVNTL